MNRMLLGEQIYGHLQLYRSLGVRHIGCPAPNARRAAFSGQNKKTPAVDARDARPAGGETLEAILADVENCRRCKLAESDKPGNSVSIRAKPVFGSGSPNAGLMFVGDAPGAGEGVQGLPFSGPAGRMLTSIIESIGLQREDVYLCNILKCHLSDGARPEPDDIAACEGFLLRQIAAVRPKVIIALGGIAAQALLKTTESFAEQRGRPTDYRDAKLIATYHPDHLLQNPLDKRHVWEDMRSARNHLRRP